jgi:3-deoxy-D-manno-octulosonate 8-phosphate phosphatase (KDO 8-P phosphatase)
MLLLDVDGVLTDGAIVYNNQGEEIKSFNVKDGLGIRMLMLSGIQVGIVTGRSSGALRHRCDNLGMNLVFDGVTDKAAVLDKILETSGISSDSIAFMGDDLPDLPLLRLVGLPIAVADAHPLVISGSLMTTTAGGGRGAVREVAEAILKARGLWNSALGRF